MSTSPVRRGGVGRECPYAIGALRLPAPPCPVWSGRSARLMTEDAETSVAPTRRSRRSSGRVTIADVARVAGMSMHTVSRVLNSPEKVPARTVQQIEQAIAQTGYVPNLLAGSLASGKSRLVAALVPAISSPVFMETVQVLTSRLMREGYQLMLGEIGYDWPGEEQRLRNIIGRRPDAIVLMRVVTVPESRRLLASAGIPIVESWDLTPDPIDLLVGFDHEAVGACVADFLHQTGRRRPAVLMGDDPRALRRLHGFEARARAIGWLDEGSALPVHRMQAPTSLGDGRTGLRALLAAAADPPDAIVCSTDMLALGVLTEATSRGIPVPDVLAVVGFGDLVFAADTEPALTTVRVRASEIGEHAARFVIARINHEPLATRSINVGFELVRRASA